MRIKLDENLPIAVLGDLAEMGHDVDTVPSEKLGGAVDEEVWAAAQAEGRFLITQDLDFSDIRRFAPGTHKGLLLIRLAAPGSGALAKRIRGLFQKEQVEGWAGCFVVATDSKVRVRHAPHR